MMQCSDARPLLDLLGDNVLEPKDCALLLDHLEACRECQRQWDEMQSLDNRFREARNKTSIPEGLMERISASLEKEESRQEKRVWQHYLKLAPTLAAVFMLIGLLVFAGQKYGAAPATVASATVDTLVDMLKANRPLEPVKDRSQISKKLGYDIKYLQLAAWQMENCGIYKSGTEAPIARFDLVRKEGLSAQRLSCYQAPQGTIEVKTGQPKALGDKNVVFGNRGALNFALWSQNGRDYLFVTGLPQSVLEEIVRKA